jgi:hypothetical protein
VVGRFPQGVGLVQPDVVQQGGDAQYLRVVGGALRAREVYAQGVNPQTVGMPVDRVLPHPGDECLYLLHR